MNPDTNNIRSEINSKNIDLLNEIIDYLQQIIKYTKDNLIKREKNGEINLEEENQNDEIELSYDKKEIKDKIKLGEKLKRAEVICEIEDEENESNKIKNNTRFLLDKKMWKLKEINYHKYINEIIKKIEDIIIKINKNLEKINNKNNQEIKYDDGIYIGQVLNGLKEGKEIYYYNNGDKFDGEWKNDKKFKGIYYFNREPFKGDKYKGDFLNDKFEGKGIYFWNDGDKYKGDWKNGKKEGKGIIIKKFFQNFDFLGNLLIPL